MQAITKVFSDIVKPYIDTVKQTLTQQINNNDAKNVLWYDLNTLQKSNTVGTWNCNQWNYVNLTYTFNSDKTVTVTGTGTGSPVNFYLWKSSVNDIGMVDGENYVLSGGGIDNDDKMEFYIDGTKVTDLPTPTSKYEFVFDSTKSYIIVIASRTTGKTHNVTYHPMICLKSAYELDPSYVPPAKTNQQLTQDTIALYDNTKVNGAVNMAPNNAATQTASGATFTVNSDKTITQVGNVTVTKDILLGTTTLPKGTYTISDGIHDTQSIDGTERYCVFIRNTGTNQWIARSDGRDTIKQTFTLAADTEVSVNLRVYLGYGDGNTYKPMITVPSYTGDYVPYAKSNKELTEELTVERGDITRLVSFSAVTSYGIRKYGKVVELYFAGTLSEAVNTWTDFLTVPEGFRPSHYVQIVSFNTYSSCKNLQLTPSGGIQSASSLASDDFIRFTATYIID